MNPKEIVKEIMYLMNKLRGKHENWENEFVVELEKVLLDYRLNKEIIADGVRGMRGENNGV